MIGTWTKNDHDALLWTCRVCGVLNAETNAWVEDRLVCNNCGDYIYLYKKLVPRGKKGEK
jgi:RNase P subunit RPR2